jgi:hypothetical protein
MKGKSMNRYLFVGAVVAALGFASPALANPNDGGIPGCNPSGETPQKCDGGSNSNDNTATSTSSVVASLINQQGQAQSQRQNQTQSQSSVNTNVNANVNTNSNSNVSAANATGGSARANATGGDSSTNNSGNSTVNVQGDTYNMRRIPVSTAYAPALTSGIDTCSGSFSAGAQTGVFGISFGGTKHDGTCELIKLGREAAQMGMPDVQCQILALDPRFNEALRRAKRSCNLPTK